MHLDQMVSIKVPNFNQDEIDILHSLWKRHLRHDKNWHFFWEGSYTVIRCSRLFMPKTIGFLKRKKIKHIDQGVWIDNISTTRKFQDEFRQMFHAFSEIAMKNIKADDQMLAELTDRVIHCFLNNMVTPERYNHDKLYWEPMMIAKNALMRALTIGQIIG